MPYFSVRHAPGMPLVIVDVTDLRPKVKAKDGFEVFYCVKIEPSAVLGAEIVIDRLGIIFGTRTKHRGVFQAKLDDVWSAVVSELEAAASIPRYSVPERVGAGAAALALLFVSCAVATPCVLAWMVVCAFRKQSGLRAMAETAVVFSLFDFRRPIRHFGRIALHGR
jgi:hypothetical protein